MEVVVLILIGTFLTVSVGMLTRFINRREQRKDEIEWEIHERKLKDLAMQRKNSDKWMKHMYGDGG